MKLIEPFLGVLHHLTNPETYAYHYSVVGRLGPKMLLLVRVKVQFDKYAVVFIGYDESFKFPAEAPETVYIKALDKKRKGAFMLIDHAVRDGQSGGGGFAPYFQKFCWNSKSGVRGRNG